MQLFSILLKRLEQPWTGTNKGRHHIIDRTYADIAKQSELLRPISASFSRSHISEVCARPVPRPLILQYIIIVNTTAHLSWRPFRLWKMFTRICQWILGSLDGLFWKSIVPEILTGSFLRKSIFFNLGATKNFFWPEKTLFGIRNPNFGGVILLKLFDPSNGLGAGNYQNSHFWAKSALDISKTAA